MPIDQRLLSHLAKSDYVPQTAEELNAALGLSKGERRQFKRVLHKLLDEGAVAKVKRDRYVLPKDADLVSGEIRFRQSGSAMLIPDNKPGADALVIMAEDTGVALHGDKVLCRLQREPRWLQKKRARKGEPAQQHARVLRILKRKNTTLTGTLKKARLFYYVIPDDPRFVQDILVPPPEEVNLTPKPMVDDKVVVHMHEWHQRHMNPEGEIVEVLGKTHEPLAEFKALLHKYNLDTDFPEAVTREVARTPKVVTKQEHGRRLDLRDVFTLTIDPDDAKDFDDALSLQPLPGGGTRIGVHIADVSHYVKGGTALDSEARKRGNSTYLVGCVIPMLPNALSNGICSLVEAEDRLTKTAFLDFDAQGNPTGTAFANTIIRSNKRLTYKQAYSCLEMDDLEAIRATPMPPSHQTGSTGRALAEIDDAELSQIRNTIRAFWAIASKLRKKRFKSGSLELDMPEVKIYVDAEGYADRMVAVEHDESHQLVEEFMLAANEAVAKAFFDAGMATLSRVHDNPEEEKLIELRDQLTLAGVKIGDLTNRREVSKMLKQIKDHPQAYTLKLAFLRSLKQACYRASYDGHYGLAKNYYLHFTSPIRRYSDLIVHRQFDFFAAKQGLDTAPRRPPKPYPPGDLEAAGSHLSITERNSQEAERESVKIKQIEYFEREANRSRKTAFAAVILDVRNHGAFVELCESMAYGLVHISTMKDDLYRLNDEGSALIGRRLGRVYAMGQTVRVAVERVDRFKRQIDFRILEDSGTAPARTSNANKKQSHASEPVKTKPKGNPKKTSRKRTTDQKFKRKQRAQNQGKDGAPKKQGKRRRK